MTARLGSEHMTLPSVKIEEITSAIIGGGEKIRIFTLYILSWR